MMRVDLVYNPVSGSFRQKHLDQLVSELAARGMNVRPRPTRIDGAEIATDAELVCIYGGDGTLRDVVEALGERVETLPLAIAPAGTINLVARELGYSRKPAILAAQIETAWTAGRESWIRSPLFRLGDLPIVSCLSLGPDSHAVAGLSPSLKARIGRYAYVAAMLRQMVRWPRHQTQISGELEDGTPFSCEAEAVIVSHGAFYAGPFRLSAKASLTSDSLELITLHRSTRLGTLAMSSAAVMRMKIDRLGIAEIRTIRNAEIGECPTPVQVDGDHVPGCPSRIAPSGLTISYCI